MPEDVHSRQILPKPYLRWLAAALNVSTVAVYLYGRSGFLREIERVGAAIPGISGVLELTAASFVRLRHLSNFRYGLAVEELTDPYRWRRRLEPSFGFLVVYSERGLSPGQFDAISDVATFIAGEVQQRELLFAGARYNHAKGGLEQLTRVGPRVGTRVATGVRHLADGAAASYAAFGLLLRREFLLLYRRQPHQRGNAKYIDDAQLLRLSEAFLKQCDSHTMVRVGEREHPLFAEVLGVPNELMQEFAFFVAPAFHAGETVAAFVLGVSTRSTEFHEADVAALMHIVLEKLSNDIETTYARISQLMIVEPIFHARNVGVAANHVFVLMPFLEPWSTRIWERLIKPVCANEDLIARRADDLYGRDIVEDIWSSICTAAIIIADITNRNPNVFYELGVAHTLGKKVVLITQNVSDIPFDLNRYRHIVYADNMDGYDKLQRELSATLRELKAL